MDYVALYLSREYTLSLIQSLKEAKLNRKEDGGEIVSDNYADIECIMREQFAVADSMYRNKKGNGGEFRIE